MKQVRWMTLLAACVCLCFGAFVTAASARQIDTSFPPVFSQLSLDEAKAKAKAEDRILVVKGTAGWCGPCRTMDKTTWRDAKVEAWFKEKGIAIQLNVDRSAKEAQDLRIKAIPAMVAFKGDKEIGRIVGLQSAEQMLAWLGRLEGGEKGDAGLLDRLRKVRADPKAMSMQERYRLAKELAQDGEIDQAADEYVWLWENMLKYEQAMYGVRGSFLVGSMQELAQEHAPAKEKFQGLRDRAWATVEDKSVNQRLRDQAVKDWADMNSVVEENERTLEWFDRVAVDPAWDQAVHLMGHRIRDLMEANERWADLGRLLRKPDAEIASASIMLDRDDDDLPEEAKKMAPMLREQASRSFRESIGRAHAAYLAAKRDKDAAALAEGAIKKDDTSALRIAMVRWAIKAKQVRESQRAWLDQAAAAGDDWPGVRTALEEALKEKGDSKTP